MIDGLGRLAPGVTEDTRSALHDLVMAATVRIHRPAGGYAPEGGPGPNGQAHGQPPGRSYEHAYTQAFDRTDGQVRGASEGQSGSFLGSGFFIAPSWVLTCAHVALRGEGRDVTVVFETGPRSGETAVAGTVVAALPEPPPGAPRGGREWPAPDLALVRLRRPVEHACMYVTERPAGFFGSGAVLYSGWTEVGGRIKRLSGQLTVQGTVGAWSDPDEQVRLGGDVLAPGMSGGPAVDLARGEVVGVLKSQLQAGMGGTSIGVERLRSLPVPAAMAQGETDDTYQAVFHAHDRYHADLQTSRRDTNWTWADIQTSLGAGAGRALSPQQRILLLGRLAELPPPVSTHSLLDILVRLPGMHRVERTPAPRSWRDGLGALYETRGGAAALELVLRYCMSVLAAERPYVTADTAAAEERLWNWVNYTAEDRLSRDFRNEIARLWSTVRHRTDRAQRKAAPAYGARPRVGERSYVLLELEPRGWEEDSYDWRVGVARHSGEVVPVREDSRGTPGPALPERLAASLAEAFRRSDEPDSPAVLQVAVVHHQLGLEVENWRTAPDEPPLGALRPVVVRPSDREPPFAEEEAREHWTRWTRTADPAVRAQVVDCEDGLRVPVPQDGWLRSLAYETVPVLCRYAARPDGETAAGLGRLVRGGFHVALLRRGGGGAEAVCAEFHRRAVNTVAEAAGAEELPRILMELRRDVHEGRAEAFWSDGTALFYDDPLHPLPGYGQLLEAP
ncbi:trypsin-like peptidase domain-containing protein [Streptomyces sp. NPDC093085]|uniref:VMAP-C domain-containing protein n=1 Tax=Streptomyces sp. NPDC093085 TaxID=3155068 RepID=UPI003441AC00